MSKDSRTVATDALATLGTIIDDAQKRDAIHLAVEPVVAGERLRPGDHITIEGGVAISTEVGAGLGIVDPFLAAPVKKGERFWFIMYPRMITSLRHVWAHPSFADEPGTPAPIAQPAPDLSDKVKSEIWLREWCKTADCPSYETVIGMIKDGRHESDYNAEYFHIEGYDAHAEIPDEFWKHAEIVIGQPIAQKPKYFSCSC